jgi:hypothetical protein
MALPGRVYVSVAGTACRRGISIRTPRGFRTRCRRSRGRRPPPRWLTGRRAGRTPPSSYPFLDSTYYANTAQNQFGAYNDISGIRQQDAYNQTDAFTAKARLDQSEPYAEQGLRENAARQGTFNSSRTNTQIGLQQRSYLQQRGDIDLKAARTHAANTAAIQAILAGLPLQQASEMASAADRQTARDQAAADAGVLTQNPSSSCSFSGCYSPPERLRSWREGTGPSEGSAGAGALTTPQGGPGVQVGAGPGPEGQQAA